MKRILLIAAMMAWPCEAYCCGGPAGNSVAVSSDGQKFTVTNIGRSPVHVTFTAWSATFNLQLAPGQSGTPYNPGTFGQLMTGYQSCYAS